MSAELLRQQIHWVDKDEQLEKLCDSWRNLSLLAIDTEFIRTQTYYPIAGLIQVNDGSANYLIDPTCISDFYPLVDIFDNPGITKAIHSCSEDLEVFQHTLGNLPVGLFDTQIAAALSGFGFSVGYANLVKAALQVELPKSETRSDWLQRPLSQAQIFYAAIDVEYLYLLAKHLHGKLDDAERLPWAKEESAQQVAAYLKNQDSELSYLRLKSAWKLQPRQLAVLKALCTWRENTAKDRDMPRNRILKDQMIFLLSQLNPQHVGELRMVEGFTERMVRRHGEKIIDLINSVRELKQEELPASLPRPLSSKEKRSAQQLKTDVAEVAEKMGIAPEILLRKRDYEQLVRENNKNAGDLVVPENLQGWRKTLIEEPLKKFVAEIQ